MEAEAEAYDGIDIGLLTTAISLSYLDFRMSDLAWRDGHPHLSAWYGAVLATSLRSKTPSLYE